MPLPETISALANASPPGRSRPPSSRAAPFGSRTAAPSRRGVDSGSTPSARTAARPTVRTCKSARPSSCAPVPPPSTSTWSPRATALAPTRGLSSRAACSSRSTAPWGSNHTPSLAVPWSSRPPAITSWAPSVPVWALPAAVGRVWSPHTCPRGSSSRSCVKSPSWTAAIPPARLSGWVATA